MKNKAAVKRCLSISMAIISWISLPASLYGQIYIDFLPALHGQSMNELFLAQLQNNTGELYNGRVKITVHDKYNKMVLQALTPNLAIRPGVNSLQGLVRQTVIQPGNSIATAITFQTGRFPENDYEYCFEFTGLGTKAGAAQQVFENCYHYSLQPTVPLSLLYPGDGDQLCNTRPDFSWQPSIPIINNHRYRIVVTQRNEGQAATDALVNNIPVVKQDFITGFSQLYPPQLPALPDGKNYAWQVTVFDGNTIVTQSEIWTFSIHCNNIHPQSKQESYRQLGSALNGNYYTMTDTIRFSLVNPNNATRMKYSITCVSDPMVKIDNLPVVAIQTGLNKIDIALDDVHGLQVNKLYLVTVQNTGDATLYMQFKYTRNEMQ